jgi:DNA-directed RNA polymerase beta subunit
MQKALAAIGAIFFRYGEPGHEKEACIRINPAECTVAYPTSTLMMQEGESLPYECRLAHKTYESNLIISVTLEVEGHKIKVKKQIGPIPMMVGSKKCNLVKKMTLAGKTLVQVSVLLLSCVSFFEERK